MTLEGKHDRIKWLVSSDEFYTDWDTIITEPFTETSDVTFTEGNEGTFDSGHTWLAVDGTWEVLAANDYLTCTLDSGYNSCVVVEKLGKDYPAVANVVIQAECRTSIASGDVGLSFRNQNISGSSYGYHYGFVYNPNSDNLTFYLFKGGSVYTLKNWVDWTSFNVDTYYTMKVVCQGNRFDCYCDNNNGELQYVGTVYDDYYQSGWYGVTCGGANAVIDDFSLNLLVHTTGIKSACRQLPV